jgi:F-type H+-transporting ATPase subunit delta
MKNPKLATRYAQALFDFAKEQSQIEEVFKDVQLIINVLKETKDLRELIDSPHVSLTKKSDLFNSIFSGKITETSFTFLLLIIKKRRIPEIFTILEQFIRIYHQHHNIKVAKLTFAKEISSPLIDQIKKLLEEEFKCNIIMDLSIDPKIIGGIVIKVDDVLIDASIASKIRRLRTEFSQNIYKVSF